MSKSLLKRQLEDLRDRLRELRIARKWLQEYRVNASPSESRVLSAYLTYLEAQEQKTIDMGSRLKNELNKI